MLVIAAVRVHCVACVAGVDWKGRRKKEGDWGIGGLRDCFRVSLPPPSASKQATFTGF